MENISIQTTKMKPILRLVFDPLCYKIVTAETAKRFLDAMKKRFGDRYEIMVTPKDLEIAPDNTTVVNLHLDNDTDIDKLIELISKLGEGINDTSEFKDQVD